MRPNCPVCGSKAIDKFSMRYAMPDGWPLPRDYTWKLCKCGMIWADTKASAEDFDAYYRMDYDPHIDIHDIARMRNLASFVFEKLNPNVRIVDYGGGDGRLAGYLQEYGFENVTTVNVDDEMPDCDVVILSQTIEHLYDLDGNISKIEQHLPDGGLVIVETPDVSQYSLRTSPPMLDFYPTHVNHFNRGTLAFLFSLYGFSTIDGSGYEYRATNAPMIRILFLKGNHKEIFKRVYYQINSIDPIKLNEPVIIYGLGDLALYQIANSDLNVAYYVDDNPIYKDAKINGIPIRSELADDDYPVLVIGNRNRQAIVEKLKGRRVIEV